MLIRSYIETTKPSQVNESPLVLFFIDPIKGFSRAHAITMRQKYLLPEF